MCIAALTHTQTHKSMLTSLSIISLLYNPFCSRQHTYESNGQQGTYTTVIEFPLRIWNSHEICNICNYFFHFSCIWYAVIGRPLTPQVPTPTRPLIESGVANILFFTFPLVVFENTWPNVKVDQQACGIVSKPKELKYWQNEFHTKTIFHNFNLRMLF